MSERISNSYQTLFQVHVLHHYWLDEGAVLFDDLRDSDRTKRLLNYDVRQFLTITPTTNTAKLLRGIGGIFKSTALGFVVLVPKGADLSALQLEFAMMINSPDFFNYTALTLQSQSIIEEYSPAENQINRYKKNVPVLSNETGNFKTAGSKNILYLSRPIPAFSTTGDNPIEALLEKNGGLVQIISEKPVNLFQAIYTDPAIKITPLPVFVHQGDVPTSDLLLEGIPDNIFALIHLVSRPLRSAREEFSFITETGEAKKFPPIFQIRFKNRSTVWEHLPGNVDTQPSLADVTTPLPLTYFGNAYPNSTKQLKPSYGLVKPLLDNGVPPKVTGLSSEIFE